MKNNYLWACMLLAPAFTACSDISLNDINTEITFPVKDLTIPIQIDNVKLSTMLDTDKDSKIKVVNGEYAVVMNGEFQSKTIKVDPIIVKTSGGEEIKDTMTKSRPGTTTQAKTHRRANGVNSQAVAQYILSKLKVLISGNADKIHDAIVNLSKIQAETHFDYVVSLGEYADLFTKVKQIHLENFTVKVPRGFIFGHIYLSTDNDANRYEAIYDSEKGILSFRGADIVSSDGRLHISGDVSGFNGDLLEDALKTVASSNGRAATEKEEKNISFDDEIGINTGEIVIYDTDFNKKSQSLDEMYESLIDEMGFRSNSVLEDITINSISGAFDYKVEDVKLEDVMLDDIPDILSDSGTDINLENPQIYLFINNSVVDGKNNAVDATSKMEITAFDKNGNFTEYNLDNVIDIDKKENYIYLSPKEVDEENKYEGYKNAKHVEFDDLGKVLSSLSDTGGIPDMLNIKTTDTRVSSDDVQDLALGVDYGISGKYVFVAPLELKENSRIKYTDTIDGWGDDIEDIAISKVTINATATTDIPFEIQLHIVPVNTDGRRIGSGSSVILPANAKDAPVTLVIEDEIRNLDGICIDALATSKDSRPLNPNMNISLSGIRVTVSGLYEKEL